MATAKVIVLLFSVLLTCYCQESSTKRPPGNTTSQIETEGGSKPVTDKPAAQKFAKQMAPPEHSSNPDSEYGQRGQPRSDPNQVVLRRPLRPNEDAAEQHDADQDSRQGRRLADRDPRQPSYPDRSQDAAIRGINRAPYDSNLASSGAPDNLGRRRIRDPSTPDLNEETYKPYSFNFIAETDESRTSRQETGDASGRVSGLYSMTLGDGRKRVVDYIADQHGFRANVDTNEPGTSSAQSPADAVFYSSSARPVIPGYEGVPNRSPHQPGLGREDYITRNRTSTGLIHNPVSSGDRRPPGHQSNRRPAIRSGRDYVPDPNNINGDLDKLDRDQTNPEYRSDMDSNIQGRPNSARNDPRSGSSSDGEVQGRQGRNYRNDGISSGFSRNRPSNLGETDQFPNMQGGDGIGQHQPDPSSFNYNVDNQRGRAQPPFDSSEVNSIRQTGDARSTGIRGENEPSYHSWFRTTDGSSRSDDRATESSLTRGARPESGRDSGYQPALGQDGSVRSGRQPTAWGSRSNAGDDLPNIPELRRPSDRSNTYPDQPSLRSGAGGRSPTYSGSPSIRSNQDPERPQLYPNQPSLGFDEGPGRSQSYPRQPSVRSDGERGSSQSYPKQPSMRSDSAGSPQSYPGQPSMRSHQDSQTSQTYPGQPLFRSKEDTDRSQSYPGQPPMRSNQEPGRAQTYPGQPPMRSNQEPGRAQTYPGQPSLRSNEDSRRTQPYAGQPSLRPDQASGRSQLYPGQPLRRSNEEADRSQSYPGQPSMRSNQEPGRTQTHPGQPSLRSNEDSRRTQPYAGQPSLRPDQDSGRSQLHPGQPLRRSNEDADRSQSYPGQPPMRSSQEQGRPQSYPGSPSIISNQEPGRSQSYPGNKPMRPNQEPGRPQTYPVQPSVRPKIDSRNDLNPGQPSRPNEDPVRSQLYPRQPSLRSNEDPENSQLHSGQPSFRSSQDPQSSRSYPGQPSLRSNEGPESNIRPQSPNIQSRSPSDQSLRPQSGLTSGEIPRHYSNYGTYWYYGH